MVFQNRVAVITGAAGNIGGCIAHELARQGVKLALCDIQKEKLDLIVGELKDEKAECEGFLMDVTDTAAVEAAARAIYQRFGKVDILINNAGWWPRMPFLKLEEELWNKVLDVNLNSVYRVSSVFAPGMVRQKYGRIINLGSIAGESGLPGEIAYSTSKAGVIMFTRVLAMELAKLNVTVNSVSPGMIYPPGQTHQPNSGTWVGWCGDGYDIARPICFLASDDSNYITGVDFTVDGGRILGPHNTPFNDVIEEKDLRKL